MLAICKDSSVAFSVGIFFFLFLVFCGIGCIWQWKHPNTVRFALPKFLQKRRSKKKDYAKTPSSSPQIIVPKYKISAQSQTHRPALGATHVRDNYENVKTGPHKAKEESEKDIYENTRQSNFEDHIYGNEPSSDYCNFQKPRTSETPQDEDIYILPDL
ncbi:PREDICTED: protein GAPT [Elephantulus edwardii]|uniref:protein GAPT n=1 Tax=Elephantulus edwardii TaxID=28737 RepID=UPI0003F074E0|nr:PREDICTED: protein GAPT [Elephantulus edwardii]